MISRARLHIMRVALCLAMVLICAGLVRGEADPLVEYQVKAAYLRQFARYVQWPAATEGATPATVRICILGSSPIGDALEALSQRTVKGRRVTVSYIRRIEELPACDILFVAASEKSRLRQIISRVGSRPVLTVSDIKRFVAAGGMIGLIPVGNNVRFEINERAALRSNLQISAQLLRLATAVVE